jgi:hypothetical protein
LRRHLPAQGPLVKNEHASSGAGFSEFSARWSPRVLCDDYSRPCVTARGSQIFDASMSNSCACSCYATTQGATLQSLSPTTHLLMVFR